MDDTIYEKHVSTIVQYNARRTIALSQTHNRMAKSHLLGSVGVNVVPAVPYVVVIAFDRMIAIRLILV